MSTRKNINLPGAATAIALGFVLCAVPSALAQGGGGGGGGGGGSRPGAESYGNNLSYPVIWSEGVPKVLRGTPAMVPLLGGTWWWWWGTDLETGDPLSCAPDPDDTTRCDDGVTGTATGVMPGSGAIKVYLQKDEFNVWQAGNLNAGGLVIVDNIDWGDNLESSDWNLNSQVRIEVVLGEDLTAPDPVIPPGWEPTPPLLEYGMRHVSGWGINEVHGVATAAGQAEVVLNNAAATVYSHCAALKIQRLLVSRKDPRLADLIWVPGSGWTEPPGYTSDLISPPLYSGAVWEGGDGPGYYSAEINVKGKVIYGYTWNVRKNNEGAGDYRFTFSLENGATDPLNTYLVDGVTTIVVPVEEEATTSSEPTTGGVPVIDFANNLTYIDVLLEGKTTGRGKKK